ncbi:MAG TPA: hypothetical protein PLQ13_11325 [Candidatus Krumholzibacteria bacterium]|nr:hypothetical protein [Candidatus Krumholzibacteria bacterium]
MRTATIITMMALLTLCGSARADGSPRDQNPNPPVEPALQAPSCDITTLMAPTLEREIQVVLDRAAAREKQLLAALVASTDETECVRLVAQIDALDLRRDLDVLKIQIRHARSRGLWDLERRLRERVDELTTGRAVAGR